MRGSQGAMRGESMDGQRFCIWCGRELRPGARFCTTCGRATKGQAPDLTDTGEAPPAATTITAEPRLGAPASPAAVGGMAPEPQPFPTDRVPPPEGRAAWPTAAGGSMGKSGQHHRGWLPTLGVVALAVAAAGTGVGLYLHSTHGSAAATASRHRGVRSGANSRRSPSANSSTSVNSSPSANSTSAVPVPPPPPNNVVVDGPTV